MMKVLRFILPLVFLLPFAACGEEDKTVETQQNSIRNYLQSTGMDYDSVGGVYRLVYNTDRRGYATEPVIARGDSVSFYYIMHYFTTTIHDADTLLSNYPSAIAAMQRYGPLGWPDGPMKIKLGSTPLLKGLNRGLVGLRENDSLNLFLHTELAYGEDEIGTLTPNSAYVYGIEIVSVKKQ